MLKLYESIPGTNIMSLRTGGPVATIKKPVINPHNLYVEGWYVDDARTHDNLILLSADIRDVLPQGFVINDYEELTRESELVRLKETLDLKFELLGLKVSSQSGKSYGKVNDFAIETNNFYVHKLYVSQPLIKNFSGGTLSIDRSQIIEITNKRIIIEDPTEEAKARATSPVIAN